MRGAFTVGAGSGSGTRHDADAAARREADRPGRRAALADRRPGFTISLKTLAGRKVTRLRPGAYTLTVRDRSKNHNARRARRRPRRARPVSGSSGREPGASSCARGRSSSSATRTRRRCVRRSGWRRGLRGPRGPSRRRTRPRPACRRGRCRRPPGAPRCCRGSPRRRAARSERRAISGETPYPARCAQRNVKPTRSGRTGGVDRGREERGAGQQRARVERRGRRAGRSSRRAARRAADPTRRRAGRPEPRPFLAGVGALSAETIAPCSSWHQMRAASRRAKSRRAASGPAAPACTLNRERELRARRARRSSAPGSAPPPRARPAARSSGGAKRSPMSREVGARAPATDPRASRR